MSKVKVQVQLTENALKDFKVIQNHDNFQISKWGIKYLKELIELSPKSWVDVHRNWDGGIFKISDFIPFDIRGKVDYGATSLDLVVLITHFKLKKVHSKVWFEKIRAESLVDRTLSLN